MESGQLRVTVGELKRALTKMINEKIVDETAVILWSNTVDKNSNDYDYAIENSVIFGLEWKENGETSKGTLKIEPRVSVSQIN